MADLGSANRWYAGLLGLLGLIALWWIAGALDWFSGTIPTPGEVISTIVDTGAAFYVDNFS